MARPSMSGLKPSVRTDDITLTASGPPQNALSRAADVARQAWLDGHYLGGIEDTAHHGRVQRRRVISV